MPKTVLFLFFVFFFLIGIFFVVQKEYSGNTPLSTFSLLKITPTPISEDTLSLEPNSINASIGKPSSASVFIVSQGDTPSLIQLEMAFDPNTISNVTLTPGNYYTNPVVLINTVNQKNGRISYALKSSEGQLPKTKSGIVAVINFTPQAWSIQKQTTLYFLPKTVIRTNGDLNRLKAAYGTTIVVSR